MNISQRLSRNLQNIATQKRAEDEGGPGRIASAVGSAKDAVVSGAGKARDAVVSGAGKAREAASAGAEAFGNMSPVTQGATIGGGAGAILASIGMAIRANPEEGRSRLRAAIKGLIPGAGAGAAMGAGAGYVASRGGDQPEEGGGGSGEGPRMSQGPLNEPRREAVQEGMRQAGQFIRGEPRDQG